MKLGYFLYRGLSAIGIFFSDVTTSMKGQSSNYTIIQTAHRIEKGLTIDNPRKLWGWDKVDHLVKLIGDEMDKENPDEYAINTGVGVLRAYREAKLATGDREEYSRVHSILEKNERVAALVSDCKTPGGAIMVKRSQIIAGADTGYLENLLSSRHSCRDFDGKEISQEVLNKAVQMALHCPSACNRQPFNIFVLEAKKKESLGFDNIYNADKYLFITGDINAFTRAEYGDWVVSASIFAGYLVLALHSLGIGSCIMKKDLVFGSKYNSTVRKYCSIPKNEKLILEIAVGYYKEEFRAAVSNRKSASDIVHYVP